jgi:hypothetical protein
VEGLEAAPGNITIAFDNQDAGVIHNLAIYEGDSADGDPLAATELETGPIEQELQVTLEDLHRSVDGRRDNLATSVLEFVETHVLSVRNGHTNGISVGREVH